MDIGCGRGTWLKAFREACVERVFGIDGPWNSQENMVEEYIEFHPFDLNKEIKLQHHEKFDLAMSVEVAEHLEPSSSQQFISSLTNFSDVIIFGAAYPFQGGANHINEQPQTYWASIFISHGYLPFDLFRPFMWGDKDVKFWYQQNTFMYVREGSVVYNNLLEKGFSPIPNLQFINCVHPLLFSNPGFRTSLKIARSSFVSAMKRKLRISNVA